MTQTSQTSNPTQSDPPAARTGAVLGEGGGLGAALLRRFEQSGAPASST